MQRSLLSFFFFVEKLKKNIKEKIEDEERCINVAWRCQLMRLVGKSKYSFNPF